MAYNARMLQDVEVAGVQPLPALIPEGTAADPVIDAAAPGAPEPALKVAVHDRSRVEWVATVPIAPPHEEQSWEITFEIAVPDAIWLPHHPWDHFTVRSRLMSPVLAPGHRQEGIPIEQLRRRALAAAHALKQAAALLVRQLRAFRGRDHAVGLGEGQALVAAVQTAVAGASDARAALGYLRDPTDDALEREHALADEFVSNHVLMLVTETSGALGAQRSRRGRIDPALHGPGAELLHRELTAVTETEMARRKVSGFKWAEPRRPNELESFVQRGALLKKHFQQALFLDARAYMVDQRLRNWIAAAMAMVASVFYFAGQLWLFSNPNATATTLSLLVACGIGALVYAAKDRIKELGRDWLARRVKHSYADRVAHLSLQERMDKNKSDFALARETITLVRRQVDDPLNSALGSTSVAHHLTVRELLKHDGLPVLHRQGLVGLKHVFRYDLSPLFVKLDDQRKRVPVLVGGKLQFRAATRMYALPVHVRLQRVGSGEAIVCRGHLRLKRDGLESFVKHAGG